MSACTHSHLELIPERKQTLRCRHCHLTISADDIGDDCCPECFETSGARRYDFEALAPRDETMARYRCEDCGAIIGAS